MEQKKIKVVLVEPMKEARIVEIPKNLASYQKIVGGLIEEYCPFNDPVAIICNDEGKINGLPFNRLILGDFAMDAICGTFFVAYLDDESESFESLPDDLLQKYFKLFELPHMCFFA